MVVLTETTALTTAESDPVRPLRLVCAGVVLAVAFYLVAGPAFDLVRLDPIVQSDAVGCTFGDEVRCPIVEAREVLESFGLLDEAGDLWEPILVLTRDLPAIALMLLALGLAAPRRLSTAGRLLLAAGVILVALVLFVPQVIYADTIDAATLITD